MQINYTSGYQGNYGAKPISYPVRPYIGQDFLFSLSNCCINALISFGSGTSRVIDLPVGKGTISLEAWSPSRLRIGLSSSSLFESL